MGRNDALERRRPVKAARPNVAETPHRNVAEAI